MKILIALLAILLFSGCYHEHKITPPVNNETIDDGEGGGGTPPATIYFGTPNGHTIPIIVNGIPSDFTQRGWAVGVTVGSNMTVSSYVEGPFTSPYSPFCFFVHPSGSPSNWFYLDEAITTTCPSGNGIFGYITVTGSGTVSLSN